MYIFTLYFKDVIDRFEKMVGHCPCFGRRKNGGIKFKKEEEETHIKPPHIPDSVNLTIQAEPRPDSSVLEIDPDDKTEAHKIEAQTFSYRELASATNNFRFESCIGEGGFGPVYRGQIKSTGQVVAVKKLNQTGFQGNKEFLVEILMFSLLRHPNLVNMIGYCAEGDQRLLVYEYMPLGSLEYHLHDLSPDMEPLDWNTRMKIAAGAANGLDYLHNKADPPVIYRDLKSSNILLGEGYHPKLSDLGLAKFGPTDDKSHVSTRVMGTHGYCAPEYGTTGKLTVKSDIYSFGVVLLELITGRRAVENTRHGRQMLINWARPMLLDRKNFVQLADPKLNGGFEESIVRKAVELALMCLREDSHARPGMSEVVLALNYLVSHLYDPVSSISRGEKIEILVDLKGSEDTLEGTRMLKKDSERERAVTEAKLWGETWREKKRLSAQREIDHSDRL